MTARRLVLVVSFVALGLFTWLAVEVYRSRTDAERFSLRDGGPTGLWGPPATALNEAARRHLEIGMESLRDESLSPVQRSEAYRASLASAEGLLVRSVRSQPAQAWSLAKLAAVRWELEPSLQAGAMDRHLELIRLGSSMAPTDPGVQMDLGKLLLLTGRRSEGAALLNRAVALSPSMARKVVDLMVGFMFDPSDILEVLPHGSETLVALREPFFRVGRGSEYADLLGPVLAGPEVDAALLRSFGETCVRIGEPRQLLDTLEVLDALAAPDVEAERAIQTAWARLTLGDPEGALADAERARALQPGVERYLEQAGLIALKAGRPDLAVEDFRAALSLAARGDAPPKRRGTLYRRIGQALDDQGKADLAYDAYKLALTLAPGESHAARRVHEMERASGVRH